MVSFPAGTGRVSAVVRVFADDFPPGSEAARAQAYLADRFRIIDATGSVVPLRLEGIVTDGMALVITLSAPAPRGLAGARIWHGVLTERFADQVNLVRVSRGGHSGSLLFTAADGFKSLP